MAAVSVGIGGCLGGCVLGAGSLLLFQKRKSGIAGPSSSNTVPEATDFSSPRFPYSSPGSGWRGFHSPQKKPVRNDLGSKSLTAEPADLSFCGSICKELQEKEYIDILSKLVGTVERLQNNPRLGVTPQEGLASKICIEELHAYSKENGGPLEIEELEYVAGRPSLKVKYQGTGPGSISFIGSHLDAVPADPEVWNYDPFKLTIEGDRLYGRGTTDCLGHVALLTRFLAQLGKARPPLKNSIIVLFISAEEGGEMGVGVDMVVKNGKLDDAKNGPVYWVDSADSQPCCGTAGTMSWSLKAKGRLFHSGFPHKGINAIELISDALAAIQERFYDDFPPHEKEGLYQFAAGSNMKPTQIECKKGSTNQICPEATAHGDIRVSPFYDVADIAAAIETYVKDINTGIDIMPTRGPYSNYILGDDVSVMPGEIKRAVLELKWNGDIDTFRSYEGIACSLDSPGHKALVQAFRETRNECKPFSVNGSLPLVRMMQKAGFDLQLCGFGCMSVYHGIDEYCTLTDMKNAYLVILRVIALLEKSQ